jgi:tRNA pseudouridine65 synthase
MKKHPVDVLFRDESILVVNKPSGMLVHRGWGRAPVVLVDLVRNLTEMNRVHPVQRLDRGASGAILFALDPETARRLQNLSANGDLIKSYLALVRGRPPAEGIIDHPIPRRPGGPRVPAMTEFRCLASVSCQPRDVSLVAAVPRTGRLHQIRRHLKHIDHPLIGDSNYGRTELNREMSARYGLGRLALHCRAITLKMPGNQAPLQIDAPIPSDLTDPLGKIGFSVKPFFQ